MTARDPGRRAALTLGPLILLVLSFGMTGSGITQCQEVTSSSALVVVPQTRTYSAAWSAAGRGPAAVNLTSVDAVVTIRQHVATTVLRLNLRNAGSQRAEAVILVPVPARAIVRGLNYRGGGASPSARLLSLTEARSAYNAIVARERDPALLEFLGTNLVQSSLFPVLPGQDQTIELTYEHVLESDGQRKDYLLPRSESAEYQIPWNITALIEAAAPVASVYSPSHTLITTRDSLNRITVKTAPDNARRPGPFRLSYLMADGDVTASLLAYPDSARNGGYFLLMAGLPNASAKSAQSVPRDVTLVIDRSGSMGGEKLDQVRAAAIQVISGLQEHEYFRIITYNERVEIFSSLSVPARRSDVTDARKNLERMTAEGGTNIFAALEESLRPAPRPGALPIVLFLTDGLPTVGRTDESVIRALAGAGNPHRKRIFTFGVGVDVNTPMLEGIAFDSRATAAFVLPQEDVEVKVASVFRRLSGPVLADPELNLLNSQGEVVSSSSSLTTPDARVKDRFPEVIPDLFEGDQLLVLGRYSGDEPLVFQLRGMFRGERKSFRMELSLAKASAQNAFVARLWASRKIAMLVDAIRKLGASTNTLTGANPNPNNDPRVKELIDEIIKLSTRFGILTEYTAFLAEDGTDLSRTDQLFRHANANFQSRAIQTRTGLASVNQEINNQVRKNEMSQDPLNGYWTKEMKRVEIHTVRQANDLTFYKRGACWVDSRLAGDPRIMQTARRVTFGSEEYQRLLGRLVQEGRQGGIAQHGDILLRIDGEAVLITGP